MTVTKRRQLLSAVILLFSLLAGAFSFWFLLKPFGLTGFLPCFPDNSFLSLLPQKTFKRTAEGITLSMKYPMRLRPGGSWPDLVLESFSNNACRETAAIRVEVYSRDEIVAQKPFSLDDDASSIMRAYEEQTRDVSINRLQYFNYETQLYEFQGDEETFSVLRTAYDIPQAIPGASPLHLTYEQAFRFLDDGRVLMITARIGTEASRITEREFSKALSSVDVSN